jgi:hypothetical protein
MSSRGDGSDMAESGVAVGKQMADAATSLAGQVVMLYRMGTQPHTPTAGLL